MTVAIGTGSQFVSPEQLEQVHHLVERHYRGHRDLVPFHGWPHIRFVATKARAFSRGRDADPCLVVAAALVYGLDHLAVRGSGRCGAELRGRLLTASGVDRQAVDRIGRIVTEARTAHGQPVLRFVEAEILCDADTLFKALPVTPVAVSHRYLTENGLALRELAEIIVAEQRPLLEEGIAFYDPAVDDQYAEWADANLPLWSHVLDAFDGPSGGGGTLHRGRDRGPIDRS